MARAATLRLPTLAAPKIMCLRQRTALRHTPCSKCLMMPRMRLPAWRPPSGLPGSRALRSPPTGSQARPISAARP